MTKQEIIKQISKPSSIFKVGGFKPSESPQSSWLGKVLLSAKEEEWPSINGEFMSPLCQLNLSDLPYKPDFLKDIKFITVFIHENKIFDEDNSESYLIRTYNDINELIPLKQVSHPSTIKPFQLEPYLEKNDCPSWENCPISIPEEFEDEYETLFKNEQGIKIGGWPTLIQGEIFWTPFNKNSEDINFAFQISSIEKANWNWGDGGVGYFGINTKTNTWVFTWQSY